MYAEKGDKMVLLPFTLEVLVVMTVRLGQDYHVSLKTQWLTRLRPSRRKHY